MPDGLTSEELQAGQNVAGAATQAAEASPNAAAARPAAARAAQDAARENNISLSDDDAQKIANMVVDAIDMRGGFDAPPDPVGAPQASPDPANGTIAAGPERPEKTSFAERFRAR